MYKCNVCWKGMVIFIDNETIPETDEEGTEIWETHSISECDFCGDPHHTLVSRKPKIDYESEDKNE